MLNVACPGLLLSSCVHFFSGVLTLCNVPRELTLFWLWAFSWRALASFPACWESTVTSSDPFWGLHGALILLLLLLVGLGGARKIRVLCFGSVLTQVHMNCTLFPSLGVSPTVSKAVKLAGLFPQQLQERPGLTWHVSSGSAHPFPPSRLFTEEVVWMVQGMRLWRAAGFSFFNCFYFQFHFQLLALSVARAIS